MNWKDISGYEGLYQVSDCGQVKSLGREKTKGPGNYKRKGKILKPILDTYGYCIVSLYKDKNRKAFFVHRLVALSFLEGDNTLTVNHKDECKTNNHVSNLEYLTQGDNVRAWIKNNLERKDEISKKAREAMQEVHGQKVLEKVLDTKTGKIFPSIKAVSRYMHEEEGAKGPFVWVGKIQRGTQDRFQIIK